jgi:hypothetical protein
MMEKSFWHTSTHGPKYPMGLCRQGFLEKMLDDTLRLLAWLTVPMKLLKIVGVLPFRS